MTPVFVRVPKTGSTSVGRALFPNTDPPHCPASDLPSGPGLYRFGFVRNPYTRCLSAYNWYRHRTSAQWTQPMRDLPFAAWVARHLDTSIDAFDPQWRYFDAPVDFIGRYETLDADFAQVLRALGREPMALPRLNTTVPNDLAAYTDEARDVVRRAYAADFDRFGYTWPTH